jgi:hypothetical protein
MLVCNVSQLHRRAAIAADLAEAAAAVDAPGTGNVVFATLVDDPASVGEHVDAFLGQIMLETASAGSTVSAGLAYAAAIVEAVTAVDVSSAAVPLVVVEAATATDAPDATVAALPARSAMLPSAFVNSPGTARQANVNGIMVNL